MMPEEKSQLLAMFDDATKWCRNAEARDADGNGIVYDNDAAVAWDLTGALCQLFGWQRACVLFGQMERHVVGTKRVSSWPARDTTIDSMIALQEFNDRPDMTLEVLRERIEAMPTWNGGSRLTSTPGDE